MGGEPGFPQHSRALERLAGAEETGPYPPWSGFCAPTSNSTDTNASFWCTRLWMECILLENWALTLRLSRLTGKPP